MFCNRKNAKLKKETNVRSRRMVPPQAKIIDFEKISMHCRMWYSLLGDEKPGNGPCGMRYVGGWDGERSLENICGGRYDHSAFFFSSSSSAMRCSNF